MYNSQLLANVFVIEKRLQNKCIELYCIVLLMCLMTEAHIHSPDTFEITLRGSICKW